MQIPHAVVKVFYIYRFIDSYGTLRRLRYCVRFLVYHVKVVFNVKVLSPPEFRLVFSVPLFLRGVRGGLYYRRYGSGRGKGVIIYNSRKTSHIRIRQYAEMVLCHCAQVV